MTPLTSFVLWPIGFEDSSRLSKNRCNFNISFSGVMLNARPLMLEFSSVLLRTIQNTRDAILISVAGYSTLKLVLVYLSKMPHWSVATSLHSIYANVLLYKYLSYYISIYVQGRETGGPKLFNIHFALMKVVEYRLVNSKLEKSGIRIGKQNWE